MGDRPFRTNVTLPALHMIARDARSHRANGSAGKARPRELVGQQDLEAGPTLEEEFRSESQPVWTALDYPARTAEAQGRHRLVRIAPSS